MPVYLSYRVDGGYIYSTYCREILLDYITFYLTTYHCPFDLEVTVENVNTENESERNNIKNNINYIYNTNIEFSFESDSLTMKFNKIKRDTFNRATLSSIILLLKQKYTINYLSSSCLLNKNIDTILLELLSQYYMSMPIKDSQIEMQRTIAFIKFFDTHNDHCGFYYTGCSSYVLYCLTNKYTYNHELKETITNYIQSLLDSIFQSTGKVYNNYFKEI